MTKATLQCQTLQKPRNLRPYKGEARRSNFEKILALTSTSSKEECFSWRSSSARREGDCEQEWQQKPPGEQESHLEDVREGESVPHDRMDKLLLDLEREDPTTDKGKQQEQDLLWLQECHHRRTGEREHLQESTRDKDTTG